MIVTVTEESGRRRGVDVRLALELPELAAHRRDHRVARAEADAAVRRVEGVVTRDVLDDLRRSVEVVLEYVALAVEEVHAGSWW
ncbi:hypothetical protein ACVW00_000836 [Marmoricola sp. URHA0025 HA25]